MLSNIARSGISYSLQEAETLSVLDAENIRQYLIKEDVVYLCVQDYWSVMWDM